MERPSGHHLAAKGGPASSEQSDARNWYGGIVVLRPTVLAGGGGPSRGWQPGEGVVSSEQADAGQLVLLSRCFCTGFFLQGDFICTGSEPCFTCFTPPNPCDRDASAFP